jgi:hypothetical protein
MACRSPAGGRPAPLAGWPHRPFLPLSLRPHRLRLGQPEGHRHSLGQRHGRGPCGAGRLPLAGRGVEGAAAPVAVGDAWAQAECGGQGQGLLAGGFGLLALRGRAPRRKGAAEAPDVRLVATFFVRPRALRACASARRPATLGASPRER